jgi:hypothetical protein
MENVIEFFLRQEKKLGHILLDEPVILIPGKVFDVLEIAGDEIIDRDDAMPFREQPVGQVRPEKTSATGYDRNLLRTRSHAPVFLRRHKMLGEPFVIPRPVASTSQ